MSMLGEYRGRLEREREREREYYNTAAAQGFIGGMILCAGAKIGNSRVFHTHTNKNYSTKWLIFIYYIIKS